jgi:prepilin-type N-terminal cleavage/methylation domain-containing protein
MNKGFTQPLRWVMEMIIYPVRIFLKSIFFNRSDSRTGFTLIETIIAIGIFSIIAGGVYFSYANVLEIFSASYLNLTALSAIENELEIIHNLAYADVGLQGGSPSGILSAQKNITYGGVPFIVTTAIRNVDDPFDGVQGGNPNDLSPADYKLVEIEITCQACPRFIPARMTTNIAPPGLEMVTNNGTLIIKVFNASGQPISGANVAVINNLTNPAINISDTTDSAGILKLVDIATSSAGFEITVSKAGYSTDKTYQPGATPNPNPLKPHATVLEQQVTETSFVIDRVSILNIKTQDKFCAGIGGIDILQAGQKLIGTNPITPKYSVTHVTGAAGTKTVNNLEFDAYDFTNKDVSYEVAGFNPISTLAVDPNGTYSLTWLMEPKDASAIAVTVTDQNGQLINDAKVTISRASFTSSSYSGRKFLTETDWAAGQYSLKTNIETDVPAGEISLLDIGGQYASMSDEFLISDTIDFGTSDTNFYNLSWSDNQPAQTSVKIQVATNADNNTWNFIGPDGTANTYYTVSDTQLHSSHNGNRYMRYKIILRTDDDSVTPSLQDITLYFHSACILSGQAYFDGLAQNTYTIVVEKAGYQTFIDTAVMIDEGWEDYRVQLSQ